MRDEDWFCGAGGTSTGLRAAGIDAIGIDFDARACEAHAANGHITIRADLGSFAFRPGARLVWASPPCQPWSSAGEQLGADDERDMIPAWLAGLAIVLPDIAIMENVKGLTFEKNAEYLGWIVRTLRSLGYDVQWRVLDAADYGVPQNRERFILIARRDGGPIRWPAPTHTEGDSLFLLPWVTMADALGWGHDLVGFPRLADNEHAVELAGIEYRERDLHSTDRPSPTVTEKGRSWQRWTLTTGANSMVTGRTDDDVQPYERAVDRPAPTIDVKAAGAWTLHTNRGQADDGTRQTRPAPAPAPAITSKSDGQWFRTRPSTTVIMGDPRISPPGHDDPAVSGSQQQGAVRVTLEELAALQGFPPGYIFTGTRSDRARQIGNAVPPPLARAIVEALL